MVPDPMTLLAMAFARPETQQQRELRAVRDRLAMVERQRRIAAGHGDYANTRQGRRRFALEQRKQEQGR